MKKQSFLFLPILILGGICHVVAQSPPNDGIPKDKYYKTAFAEITDLLNGTVELDLRRATFLPEWAYQQGRVDYETYCNIISYLAENLTDFMKLNGLDKHPIGGNIALFEFFTSPNPLNGHKEYIYDFEDCTGEEDWTNTFVTKLIRTHSGQCRSLPLLYKILANEIGAKAWIAYAPNHTFIRHRDEKDSRWVNVELTNHSMPREVFIVETMGVTKRAIETGIYMKPCADREIVINLLAELALGYQHLYEVDGFAWSCVNTVLQYEPNNLLALLIKADWLYTQGVAYQNELKRRGLPEDKWSLDNYAKYKATQQQLTDLGYTEMPKHLYEAWLKSVKEEIARRKQIANNH